MADIKLGHASTGNAEAANQVKISNYYDGGWTVVLRPKTQALAIKSSDICRAGCDNNNILYSQGSRNTLRVAALKAAGLAVTDENLPKVTAAHVKKISEKCYADCSSFMTFCATAGGANFKYDCNGSGNAAVCSTMRAKFTNNGSDSGSYKALTDAKYTKSSEYLQRGDILVNESQHTVMVLEGGDYAGTWEEPYVAVTTTKIAINTVKINTTSLKINVRILQLKDGKEALLDDKNELNLYKWTYKITSLKTSKTAKSGELQIKAAESTLSFTGLEPGHSYSLIITATEKSGKNKLKSSKIMFNTALSYPSAVSNLSVSYNKTEPFCTTCTISFDAPDWGTSEHTKCYRTILYINGLARAYNDSLISSNSSCNKKKISLNTLLAGAESFTFNDVIQIGIQPGLKDNGKFLYDSKALRCSQPFYIKHALSLIDKIYLKLGNKLKRVIIFNK